MKVIAFTGMPGAGKSEAVAVAAKRGWPVVRMGDMVWAEVERRGLPRSSEHVGPTAHAMREEHGADIWARQTIAAIPKGDAVVVDGVRSLAEVQRFRHDLGPEFLLVVIAARTQLRHARMGERMRADDPVRDHATRDRRELGWGLGELMQAADRTIVNEGSREMLQVAVDQMLDQLV